MSGRLQRIPAAWAFLAAAGCAPFVRAADVDRLYDMGPAGGPVARGAIGVHAETLYSRERGYGWEAAPARGFRDASGLSRKADAHYPLHLVPPGKDLYCDGFEDTRPIRFRADVPPGEVLVTVTVGRYQQARHDLRVRINGTLVADNVDAWGSVWGSQGGTPVKSVKLRLRTADGAVRVEVDHRPSRPDSWKEYTSRRPEGGHLWYLGRNMSSILGVRIRTAPSWPVARQGTALHAAGLAPPYGPILSALNDGAVEKAISRLGSVPAGKRSLEWAAVSDAIAAHLDTPDEQRIALLEGSRKVLRALKPPTPALRERIEAEDRMLLALRYMRMWSYSWAQAQTGLNGYKRYWGVYELCNGIEPQDPLYPLALLLKMRVSYWNGREGGWTHCYALARAHALELKGLVGGHDLVRMYLGESIRHAYQAPPAPPGAPRWAGLQREALGRLREVIRYWVEHRQAPNGELGGGWGDDVEILRDWVPLVLAVHDPVARAGAQRIADGVYASGDVENGYSRGVGDVEHAAEPVSDTQPLMMATQFGRPEYFERCLATMRCMRDVWTARDRNGDLHFKSHWFSATKTVNSPPRSADVPLNGRAVKPGIWVAWYSGHPQVRKLLADWSMAWVRAARRTDRGKPAGIVPGSVSFPEGRIGGYADHWWQTKGYDDLTAMGYTSKLYQVMLAAWAQTGRDELIEPILAALAALRAAVAAKGRAHREGSLEWAGALHDARKFFDVVEKWRVLSGDARFDDLILPRATGMMRFRLTGDASQLERELAGITHRLCHNLPMITTEVLFTDRVSIPGNTVLASMLTGSTGEPTYYPLHAVTWDGIGDGAAAMVTRADRRTLKGKLYAFGQAAHEVSMRLWRLEPGVYDVTLAPADKPKTPLRRRELRVWEKGTPVSLKLPPRQVVQLEIAQKRAVAKPERLPDLAVGPRDVKLQSGAVDVTVHNLGTKRAGPFAVRASGRGWRRQVACAGLDAPLDLAAKAVTVRLALPAGAREKPVRVEVDPDGAVTEMYELNNVVEAVGPGTQPERTPRRGGEGQPTR